MNETIARIHGRRRPRPDDYHGDLEVYYLDLAAWSSRRAAAQFRRATLLVVASALLLLAAATMLALAVKVTR